LSHCSAHTRHPHSFPTRRSSDLAWLKKRGAGFRPEARGHGLEPPRGLLLLGVQGCGKSLCAKAVASEWGLPLLRLDASALYDKRSEEHTSELQSRFDLVCRLLLE